MAKKAKQSKKAKKHIWLKSGKDIEIFAYTAGEYHNGPKCKVCGFNFCHHCFPKGYETTCPHPALGSDSSKLIR